MIPKYYSELISDFHNLIYIIYFAWNVCSACIVFFHRKSALFLLRRRLRMRSHQSSKKGGRWVWWHLLFQRGTTVTELCLWILLYVTIFCLAEEKENDYRCLVLLWAQTWLSGRPAEPGYAVLLRQAVCDRAGGAQIAGWVRAGPPLTSS